MQDRLLPAIIKIEEDFGDVGLSLKDLAATVYVSEERFRKLFKQTFGVSPGEYIYKVRLEYSKRLLIESSLPVGAVACICGFRDVFGFCRFFKNRTGITPTSFRKTNIE